MTRHKVRRPNGGIKAFVLAVLVHGALVALVVVGFRWQSKPLAPPPPQEQIVQAKTVNEPEVDREIERLKKQEERKRQQDAEKQRQDEAKKKIEVEKKRKLDEQKLTDAKRKLEEDQKRKAESEKKHKTDEQQKLSEAKKHKEKNKDDEARRKEAERTLKEQLVADEKLRQQQRRQAEQTQQAKSEIAKYEALIRQKVERSWARPPSVQKGMECSVRVRLVQSGEVMSAQVIRSSGNAVFDRSVENAVHKASPLPLPEDKSLFDHFRELEFIFRPED